MGAIWGAQIAREHVWRANASCTGAFAPRADPRGHTSRALRGGSQLFVMLDLVAPSSRGVDRISPHAPMCSPPGPPRRSPRSTAGLGVSHSKGLRASPPSRSRRLRVRISSSVHVPVASLAQDGVAPVAPCLASDSVPPAHTQGGRLLSFRQAIKPSELDVVGPMRLSSCVWVQPELSGDGPAD